MEKLVSSYKKAMGKLPKSAKTKINKSDLDRGLGGIYTKRRKRSDVALVPFESFQKNHNNSFVKLDETYTGGWFIVCSPSEYFSNLSLLQNASMVVRYQTYLELEKYPANIDWKNISTNRHDYKKGDTIFVKDIKNLDKTAKKGKTIYVGPSNIGQHEMDFATEEEILKVKMTLLYQMTKMVDFKEFFDNKSLKIFEQFSNEFEKTPLFLENPKLIELTNFYGNTVCPELIKFPNKKLAILKFSDILEGTIEGDLGREDFNRTTTKINLHHREKLIAGKLNHNHRNVFLGTNCGNTIDAALQTSGISVSELLISN